MLGQMKADSVSIRRRLATDVLSAVIAGVLVYVFIGARTGPADIGVSALLAGLWVLSLRTAVTFGLPVLKVRPATSHPRLLLAVRVWLMALGTVASVWIFVCAAWG